jgi:hypothetical protein
MTCEQWRVNGEITVKCEVEITVKCDQWCESCGQEHGSQQQLLTATSCSTNWLRVLSRLPMGFLWSRDTKMYVPQTWNQATNCAQCFSIGLRNALRILFISMEYTAKKWMKSCYICCNIITVVHVTSSLYGVRAIFWFKRKWRIHGWFYWVGHDYLLFPTQKSRVHLCFATYD